MFCSQVYFIIRDVVHPLMQWVHGGRGWSKAIETFVARCGDFVIMDMELKKGCAGGGLFGQAQTLPSLLSLVVRTSLRQCGSRDVAGALVIFNFIVNPAPHEHSLTLVNLPSAET